MPICNCYRIIQDRIYKIIEFIKRTTSFKYFQFCNFVLFLFSIVSIKLLWSNDMKCILYPGIRWRPVVNSKVQWPIECKAYGSLTADTKVFILFLRNSNPDLQPIFIQITLDNYVKISIKKFVWGDKLNISYMEKTIYIYIYIYYFLVLLCSVKWPALCCSNSCCPVLIHRPIPKVLILWTKTWSLVLKYLYAILPS